MMNIYTKYRQIALTLKKNNKNHTALLVKYEESFFVNYFCNKS